MKISLPVNPHLGPRTPHEQTHHDIAPPPARSNRRSDPWKAPTSLPAATDGLQSSTAGTDRCTLCGLPVGRAGIILDTDDEVLRFCCLGCRHVFQILYNSTEGIPADFRETELYRICVEAGLIPGPAADAAPGETTRAAVDAAAASEVKGGAEETHLALDATLSIAGMWCSACAWLVEEVLRGTCGVLVADVVFASDLAHLKYLPHRVQPAEIIALIERLGYRAAPAAESTEHADENKRLLMRLGVSVILTANIMMISFGLYGGFFEELGATAIHALSIPLAVLATAVLFYGGFPIFRRAAMGLRHGTTSMETLIAVGALAAYLFSAFQMGRGSLHLYFDTAAMLVTLVLLGKTIEATARDRVSRGMRKLHQLAQQKVRLRAGSRETWTMMETVRPGDEFIVQGGERVPVDGRVLAGSARLDEALLTGEARPVTRTTGEEAMAGSLLLEGSVCFQATRVGAESTLGQILTLLQQALQRKIPVELLADRITRRLVPGVLALAAATALFLWGRGIAADDALLRAVTVLVITCPCALGIAIPLARVAAIGVGRKLGMVIRDAGALEKLTNIDVMVFDKTGTLTEGNFALRAVLASEVDEQTLLSRAASVELHSDHFLAREMVRRAEEAGLEMEPAIRFEALEGQGVKGVLETVGEVIVGNRHCLAAHALDLAPDLDRQAEQRESQGATVVFCGWAGRVQGLLVFADALRPSALPTIERLRSENIAIHMVSGDSRQTVRAVAATLGIGNGTGEALPRDKVAIIRELQQQGRRVAMLGDGLNDAAALAQADVGLALGLRAKLTHEAADITLLADDPARLLQVLHLASRTMRTIRQNLFFAFAYNLLGIPLAVAGLLNPLIAVCAMLASSLTVVANTLRLTRINSEQ
jgi:heavy metal translocating P-type ATPase